MGKGQQEDLSYLTHLQAIPAPLHCSSPW